MAGLKTLPTAQADVQAARAFYKRAGALPQYDHCHEVYQTAATAGIVEEDVVRSRRQPLERRWANVVLRRLSLFHVIDYDMVGKVALSMPQALTDERVMEEILIYSRLTELERRGAPKTEFAGLLNHGKRPLAPLIKMADYAVTHDTEDQLEGFIANGKPSIIRQYASVEEARSSMKRDLKAGERIWARLAEVFGYQKIAGDIYFHSFKVNHPEIYGAVMTNMAEELTRLRLTHTQVVVGEVAKTVAGVLKSYGFEVEVTMRKVKHPGKQMRKVLDFMTEDHESSSHEMSLEEYSQAHAPSFDFDRFNDRVAIRVIVKKFRGQDIDSLITSAGHPVEGCENSLMGLEGVGRLIESIPAAPLRLAVKAISEVLSSLGLAFPDSLGSSVCSVEFKSKKNGYRGFHFDSRSEETDPMRILPFEIQLKTPEWNDISERGKAAHYLYVRKNDPNVDPELIEMLGAAYQDVLYRPENGNGGQKSERRPSLLPP